MEEDEKRPTNQDGFEEDVKSLADRKLTAKEEISRSPATVTDQVIEQGHEWIFDGRIDDQLKMAAKHAAINGQTRTIDSLKEEFREFAKPAKRYKP